MALLEPPPRAMNPPPPPRSRPFASPCPCPSWTLPRPAPPCPDPAPTSPGSSRPPARPHAFNPLSHVRPPPTSPRFAPATAPMRFAGIQGLHFLEGKALHAPRRVRGGAVHLLPELQGHAGAVCWCRAPDKPPTPSPLRRGCIGRGGRSPPPPSKAPGLCPATVSLTASASFGGIVTDSNRPEPLWQPPPTACLTACRATSEVLSL